MNSSNSPDNGDNVSPQDAMNFLMDSSPFTDGAFYNQENAFNFFNGSSSAGNATSTGNAAQSDHVGTNNTGTGSQQQSAPTSSDAFNPLYYNLPQHFSQIASSGLPFPTQHPQPNAAISFQNQIAASISSNQQHQIQHGQSNNSSMLQPVFPNSNTTSMLMNLSPSVQGFHQQVMQNVQPHQGIICKANKNQDNKSVSDDISTKNMTPEEKRRYDRNLREQQRSYKISQQIKELRSVLQESNIPFKPNKYSILLSVVEYIKELQTRAVYLDQEHQKLLNTIAQTNELCNSRTVGFGENNNSSGINSPDTGATMGNDAELLFVKGLDYKSIFTQCSGALCVASLDGRLLDCNTQFEKVSGFGKEELQQQSLFNFLSCSAMEDLFIEMGKLVEAEVEQEDKNSSEISSNESNRLRSFWSGQVHRKDDNKEKPPDSNLYMNITLTRSRDGRPQFLNCALTAK